MRQKYIRNLEYLLSLTTLTIRYHSRARRRDLINAGWDGWVDFYIVRYLGTGGHKAKQCMQQCMHFGW